MTPALIDWRLVAFSALWISGLSVLLATISFADYTAHTEHVRLREALARRGYQTAIYAGLTLFAVGLSGTNTAWWQTALWVLVALGAAYLSWRAWKGE